MPLKASRKRYSTHLLPAVLGGNRLGFDPDADDELQLSRNAEAALHTDRYVADWIERQLATPLLRVRQVPLSEMANWSIDPVLGDVRHQSGRFFSVLGVRVKHRTPAGELEWDQPVIDQPEVGILGILVKKIGGLLHFCLQAKEEPGNINSVQISPTVQATFSNYSLAHGGSRPPFVEHFLAPSGENLLFARLQTEDGGRFLFKSNRNMVVRVADNELENLPDRFIWLTLRQIAALLKRDNLMHATTRSILSSLALRHGLPTAPAQDGSFREMVQWLDNQKAANHFLSRREGLNTLQEWSLDPQGYFSHRDGRFFRVVGIDVSSAGREVASWSQPLLWNPEKGIIGLLMQVRKGERFFLMQAKAELGNASFVLLGPTVQFTPGNYAGNAKLHKPFLFDEFSGEGNFCQLHQNFQAEEGARFFQESHLHRVLMLPEGVRISHPADFFWVSEGDLRFFLHLGQTVNSCARSVLATLL